MVLKRLYAVETIEENPQSVEKYGLNNPVATVSTKYKNKDQSILKVGSLSADKNIIMFRLIIAPVFIW